MDLSIIIINWNSAKYLRKCLQSIYSHTSDMDFEIIVVDNASYDGCKDILDNEFPDVKFVQNKINIGFAQANNIGFKYSKGRILLFLNPDTEIIGSAITIMFSYLQSLPNAGAVGCKLLNSDLSLQTNCILPFPNILNYVLDIEYLKLKFPKLNLWGIKPLFFNKGVPDEVEVISGACMMIKREVFEKIKYFSPEYFMYAEELDLCYKMKKSGYKVFYISEASIIHYGGGSTKHTPNNKFSIIMVRESLLKFVKKTRGDFHVYIYRVTTTVVAICRLIIIASFIPIGILFLDKKGLYISLDKWKTILKWSVGLEK